jgi:hypothetical protein
MGASDKGRGVKGDYRHNAIEADERALEIARSA